MRRSHLSVCVHKCVGLIIYAKPHVAAESKSYFLICNTIRLKRTCFPTYILFFCMWLNTDQHVTHKTCLRDINNSEGQFFLKYGRRIFIKLNKRFRNKINFLKCFNEFIIRQNFFTISMCKAVPTPLQRLAVKRIYNF